ncbi:hypothetical protein ABDX87_06110 [Pseudomonas abietaniphila]|uniref:hypothetical protein n=1 Tax=Pseudomonas abietaniphila TaxID=89065 RepID=UPI003216D213
MLDWQKIRFKLKYAILGSVGSDMYDYRERVEYLASNGLKRLSSIQYQPELPMGKIAKSMVSDVFAAWFAGLEKMYSHIFPRAIEWIDLAIKRSENFGEHEHLYNADILWGQGLAIWARENINATETWRIVKSYDDKQQTIYAGWSPKQMATKYLDDHLAFCYLAGEYDAGIAAYRKYHGVKDLTVKAIRYPRDLGYALCLREAHGEFLEVDFIAVGRRVLKSHLDREWLSKGQYIRAMTWLKIVYWNLGAVSSPFQCVVNGYDDMPDVVRPEF